MKKNKITLSHAVLLITTFVVYTTYSMETQPTQEEKSRWISLAADVILQSAQAYKDFLSYIHSEPTEELTTTLPYSEPSEFVALPIETEQLITEESSTQSVKDEASKFAFFPLETQQMIIFLLSQRDSATTLKDAAHAINALAQVNQELNRLINNPQFCLQIIKKLAQQFDCSDEVATEALQTQEAKKRLAIQKKFEKLFVKPFFDIEKFNTLYTSYKGYIDLNFTYRNAKNSVYDDKNTLLINAAMYPSPLKKSKLEVLLKTNKVNINYQNAYKNTALITCAYYCDDPTALQILTKNPNIMIDLPGELNNTALITACLSMVNKQTKSACIFVLLFAGADPEKVNDNGLTPLYIVKKLGNEQEIQLIKDAIEKKHKKSKKRRRK